MSKFDLFSSKSIKTKGEVKKVRDRSNAKRKDEGLVYTLVFPDSIPRSAAISISNHKIIQKINIDDVTWNVILTRKSGPIDDNETIVVHFPASGYPGRGYDVIYTVRGSIVTTEDGIAYVHLMRSRRSR